MAVIKLENLIAQFNREAPWLRDAAVPSGSQADLVLQIAQLYERHGLLTNECLAPALWDCCPNAVSCWGNLPASARREPGGVSLPWVGPDYQPGGVAVIGMNFNEASGLTMAFQLADYELQGLGAAKRRMTYEFPGYRGSMFAYRSTRTASLLVDVVDCRPAVDQVEPQGLVSVLRRLVRLQSVKCSPDNGRRSAPEPQMWKNCPPMLLLAELNILRPSALIGFGAEAGRALSTLPGYERRTGFGDTQYGVLDVDGQTIQVFVLGHPAAPRPAWQTSHDDLIAGLAAKSFTFAAARA